MPDSLTALSAVEQVDLLHRRRISSRELLEAHLARVREQADVNAVVAVDEDAALRSADLIDESRARGGTVGPLGGLPMTIKDGWEVAGLISTDGDPQWRHHVPIEDAPVVARVRAADAVIFGKSNVPIHCADAQSYNDIYGTTCNPWDVSLSPGGSSGGAAAALAASLTPLEVGSDIAGSIRLPAAWCGVYGLKSSYGALPSTGHVPGARRSPRDMSVAGPMARTADDLRLLHDVLTDDHEPRSAIAPLSSFRATSWIGMDGFETDAAVEAVLDHTVEGLSAGGLHLTRSAMPLDTEALLNSYYLVLAASGAAALDDAAFAGIEEELAQRDVPPLRRATLRGLTLSHRGWLQHHEIRTRMAEQIERVLTHEAELVLCPTVNVTAQPHDQSQPDQARTIVVNGQVRNFYSVCDWNAIASYTYLPAVSIPVGLSPQGLPIGLQAIGRRGSDRRLVEFARACEEVLGRPQAPTSPPGSVRSPSCEPTS